MLRNAKLALRARIQVQFDVDKVLQNGDMHSFVWQMMFLIHVPSSNANEEALRTRLGNSLLASNLALKLQSRYRNRKIRVSRLGNRKGTNQDEVSNLSDMIYEKTSFSNIMKHVSNLKLRNEHMSFLNPNNNHGAEGLVAAVKIDDVILLDALLSYDSSLHPNGGVISNGETAIHTAARNGRVRCMRYLLRHLSNRTDRSGFIFRPRHDGEVPKRTALCATVGIDRDAMSSTQSDYHNDCLEQLYCFGRDIMDMTEYGPTSYENYDGPDISICSYLAAAMKACANCASTFMYSSTIKFEDVNIATDIVAKLQDCVERSALTLRNERCGPSPWTHCLELLSSCSARPIYREMRMINWIASKETVRFQNRDLNSPWEDLADSNNNIVQDLRSKDNTIIIRLCRVGPHKGRDDVYVVFEREFQSYIYLTLCYHENIIGPAHL